MLKGRKLKVEYAATVSKCHTPTENATSTTCSHFFSSGLIVIVLLFLNRISMCSTYSTDCQYRRACPTVPTISVVENEKGMKSLIFFSFFFRRLLQSSIEYE
jgi:hypothetical protein